MIPDILCRISGYNANRVLGAAMVMLEIAGVKILYTGEECRIFNSDTGYPATNWVMPLRPPCLSLKLSAYTVND